tara:strand:+ start:200 stop:538 length:339 start_codon:yes stop_codon:yes gene_type:complete
MTSSLYPLEILLEKNKKKLKVKFNDNKSFSISAELLRVESPSAEVQGHGRKVIVKNKKDVQINNIELIGNYAIKIIFSDGHDSGLYTWEKLLEFGLNEKLFLLNYYETIKRS